jgi:hypothetical protein
MKNGRPAEEQALDAVLRQWTVEAALPPRFQEQVWQRIARAGPRREAGLAGAWWRLIAVALPRPGVAVGYVAALLALGVAGGSWAAQVRSHQLQAALGLRYVQSLDPYRGGDTRP